MSTSDSGDHAIDLAEAKKRLAWYMGTTDAGNVVIRGAILLESAFEDLLRATLVRADELLQIKNMPLARKARLAAAVGLIDQETLNLVDEYRRFRNDVAHRFGFEVSREDEESLLRRFESHGYFHLDKHYDPLAFPRTLKTLLIFLYTKIVLSSGFKKIHPREPNPDGEKWRDHIFPTYFIFQILYPENSWERTKDYLAPLGIYWTPVEQQSAETEL